MIHADIKVSGQVQGVGFRPFVWRLARELGLSGWVRNSSAGVEIAVEGEQLRIMHLIERLQSDSPVLARVERVTHELGNTLSGLQDFTITESRGGRVQTGIAPDAAVCPECLAELFDPSNRRYRHPFVVCINCGPRYTLTARLPYDRANTSMAAFPQCCDCQGEYDNPATRRFHAQPNACPKCGPRLKLFDAQWREAGTDDPVAATAAALRAGYIVAVRGVGGFHLMCDAGNAAAVAQLRSGKRREEKPFAVMVPNAESARRYADFGDAETALLESGARPIVLLEKSAACDAHLEGIAPGLNQIGLMLPYAPLHYLLFHELLGRPRGGDWLSETAPVALVATSANPGGEPLARDDEEAREILGGLADFFLTHDRDILHRCDDSVLRISDGAPAFIRRARGYTPQAIKLPAAGPSVLATGGWLKNTVCVTRGDEAFVSQHIGDLDCAGTRHMLDETVDYLCGILDVEPEAVAHDLHPDFYSTQFAERYAEERGLPRFAVQHHHAHIAAVAAEHCFEGAVLGLALDGVGLGDDGTAWGGELMRMEGVECERLGHLAAMLMPGGDRAAREPWRMAAAALHGMRRGDEIADRFRMQAGASMVRDMLRRNLNCTATSSAGRLFDAAAGLLGVSTVQGYEGQAAMLLEGLAAGCGQVAPLERGYVLDAQGVLSFTPLLAELADCDDTAMGAALFHATLAEGFSTWVLSAAERHDLKCVALGGGCFLNAVLSRILREKLFQQGLRVLEATHLPPNDGAISFGQAAVALHYLNSRS